MLGIPMHDANQSRTLLPDMRAFIKNDLEAEEARGEEVGERGISLIELIVVILVLGIVVGISIPIFLGLQQQAQQAALETATANAGLQAAAAIAAGDASERGDPFTVEEATFFANTIADSEVPGISFSVEGTDLDTLCVTGSSTDESIEDAEVGPGCDLPEE